MKNQKLLFLLIFIASLALFAVVGVNVYAITNIYTDTYQYVSSFTICSTSIFAIYYMVSGCNKEDSAKYFKFFMILFALNQLVSSYGSANYSMVLTMASVLAYGFLCILTVAKDLGKARSLTLAGLVFACMVVKTVVIMKYPLDFYTLPSLTGLLISMCTILMVIAKYNDKASRGSK